MTTSNAVCVDSGVGRRTSHQLPADWLEHLGWYRCYFADDRWIWSPQMEEMHGYKPVSTAPSTRLLLSHVHLDDYERVAATLRDARRTQQAFSSHHRIVDTCDRVHDVVLIGAPFHDTRGAVLGMQGFYLDLSQAAALAQNRRYEHATNQLRIVAAGNGYAEDRRQQIRAATQC